LIEEARSKIGAVERLERSDKMKSYDSSEADLQAKLHEVGADGAE
jgi:hypothetical protein